MRMPAYPAYKDSGAKWLRELPVHWNIKRGRFIMQVNPSSPKIRKLMPEDEVSFVPMDAVGEYGGLRLNLTKQIDEIGSGYTAFQDDDVVVAKITPCFENGKGALAQRLKNGAAYGTTELHVLRALPELNPRYLFYVTISAVYRETGEAEMYGAGGQKRVPPDFNKNFRTPLPPSDEQHTIIRFLDYKTAQIDALIAKKETLLTKLAEKRTALISHAVTKGLDPSVPMKDSGVVWLGEVPEHWGVLPLKYAIMFQRGHDLPADDRIEGDIPLVSSSGVSSSHDCAMAKGPGIVTGRYGTIGKFTYVEPDYWPLNTTLYSIKTYQNNEKYLWFMLHLLAGLFILNSKKGAVPGIDRNDLHPVLTVMPPRAEQDAILEYLKKATSKIDQHADKVCEAIEKLKEYRSALITNAVTGKIDVRSFTLFDEAAHA